LIKHEDNPKMTRMSTFLLGLLVTLPCIAQDPSSAALSPEQTAVKKDLDALVADYKKAFDAADAKGVAATFTEDATISDDSGETKGRNTILERFTEYFETQPKSTIEVKVESLLFVSPEVVIENGETKITATQAKIAPEVSKYTVVYVRQNGKWLQSSLRELGEAKVQISEKLKELDWLVGEWMTEGPEAIVNTKIKWSDDHHFLIRDFTVVVAGKPEIKGTQRIGWDAARKQVRSWLFDSKGGFGEAFWSRDGDQWMIKSVGTSADGEIATATQLITREGKDHLKWSSFDRTIGEAVNPEVEEVRLVKKPPAPKTK
jgi:uncharacterized protein (TIGR02246 family)